MVKLVVFADDMTGALDTAVQFTKCGIHTVICSDQGSSPPECDILVINTHSRHMQPWEAYDILYQYTVEWQTWGVQYFYIKTDSLLRGNIGAGFAALTDATASGSLFFIPAYPQNGRTTRNGYQYCNDVLLTQSDLAQDVLDSVSSSYIPDILKSQFPHMQVKIVGVDDPIPQHTDVSHLVLVFDAVENLDLKNTMLKIKAAGTPKILAGCAGFARYLPELLDLEARPTKTLHLSGCFLFVCGSLSPTSRQQLDYAQQAGFARFSLTVRQKLEEGYFDTPDGKHLIAQLCSTCQAGNPVIIDVANHGGVEATKEYAIAHGIPVEQISTRIVEQIAELVKRWLAYDFDYVVMISGGDTVLALIRALNYTGIIPIGELSDGVVISDLLIGAKKIRLITKSGGFGNESELVDIQQMIQASDERR